MLKANLKIIFSFLLLLLLLGAENLLAQTLPSPAQPYILAGDRLFEQGKWREALTAYEQALTLDPKNQYVSFQIIQLNVRLASGQKPFPETLPPRDYTKIPYELGPFYKDGSNRFALRYPKGWLIDNSAPYFDVKFIDSYYEAFIFVKTITSSTPFIISYETQMNVENLVKNLASQIPGAKLKYCNFEKLLNTTVLRVEVHYQAGSNNIVINCRILSELDRVVIVSWVTQERLLPYFRNLLESSVATLTLSPQ